MTIGVTLWDTPGSVVADMGATVFLRALPAAGAGEPVRATAISATGGDGAPERIGEAGTRGCCRSCSVLLGLVAVVRVGVIRGGSR